MKSGSEPILGSSDILKALECRWLTLSMFAWYITAVISFLNCLTFKMESMAVLLPAYITNGSFKIGDL